MNLKFLIANNIFFLLQLLISQAIEYKKYKQTAVSSFEIADELFQPKTLIECCNICMISETCNGVLFDGEKCTRLCGITPSITDSDAIGKAWVDETYLNSIKSKLSNILYFIERNLTDLLFDFRVLIHFKGTY